MYISNEESIVMDFLVFNLIVTVSYSYRVILLPFIFSDLPPACDPLYYSRPNPRDHTPVPEVRDRNSEEPHIDRE